MATIKMCDLCGAEIFSENDEVIVNGVERLRNGKVVKGTEIAGLVLTTRIYTLAHDVIDVCGACRSRVIKMAAEQEGG